MKQSFKKVVSILLVAMLLVSVLSAMFVTTANAATATTLKPGWNDVIPEVYGGSSVAGSEATFTATGQRVYLTLDGTSSTRIKSVSGKAYTVTFEYYDVADNGVAGADGFRLYIGGNKSMTYCDKADIGAWTTMSVSSHGILNSSSEIHLMVTMASNATGDKTVKIRNIKIREGGEYIFVGSSAVNKEVSAPLASYSSTVSSTDLFNVENSEGKLHITNKEGLGGYYAGSTSGFGSDADCIELQDFYVVPNKSYKISMKYTVNSAENGTTLQFGFAAGAANDSKEMNIVGAFKGSVELGEHEFTYDACMTKSYSSGHVGDNNARKLRLVIINNNGTNVTDFDVTVESITVTADAEDIVYKNTFADAEYIEKSTRAEDNGDPYVSAGIRFKASVRADVVEQASKIEYILVPSQEVNTTIADYVAADGKYQFKGVVKDTADGTSIVYETSTGFVDYQAILVGLTRKDVANSLKNVQFKVALAITTGGSTDYFEAPAVYSYDSVASEEAAA